MYNEQFLNVYKEFEAILRNQNVDYKALELNSDDLIMNRLRICRQIRNYLTHNNDNIFIDISKNQVKFIKEMIETQKMKDDVVKKHLGRINNYTCSIFDKCTDILNIMSKRNITQYPVLDEIKGECIIKIVSIWDVAASVLESKTKRIKEIEKFTNNFIYVDPLCLYNSIPKEFFVFCTDNGTKDGKILGIVK